MASGACLPNPLSRPKQNQPLIPQASCRSHACNLHIDGMWLASGMNLFHQTKSLEGANQSDTAWSRRPHAVPDSPGTRGPWLGENSLSALS